jgi:hypothetical protein
VITVLVFPAQALGYSTKLLDRARRAEPDNTVQHIDMQLYSGFKLQLFPNSLGDDDLKFW